jgi:hypothetical protein
MSYLETGKGRFTWIAAVAQTSVRPELGCVQCGSSLDAPEFGKFNMSGKCLNCTSGVSDEDEGFDDLED